MQHTENYNLSIIETSDAFSPDALNANAQTLEAQLARMDAALATKAPQTEIARVDAAAAAEKNRVDAALIERPRVVTGTYTGAGAYGAASPNKLDFADTLGCAPKLLIVASGGNYHQLIMVNGAHSATAISSDYKCPLTWTETGVTWYTTSTNSILANSVQLNEKGTTYHYIAFA